ncbi:unnamed protein product [marine sediment metagenome]|uniref:Uncharacterized protein n=1 Tax=marine sediment metagenome TaxID=412755 RepID=X1RF58_9ZZZZ
MSNKNPSTRVITIPAQFLPLIEKERERRGCFSQHECMGQILHEFFGSDGLNEPKPGSQENPDQVIQGVKLNA